MVKENIIIPKENLAKVEEVRELENQIQSKNKLVELVQNWGVATTYCAPNSDKGKEDKKSGSSKASSSKKSEDDDKDREARIVQIDTAKEARQHDKDEKAKMKREAYNDVCKLS